MDGLTEEVNRLVWLRVGYQHSGEEEQGGFCSTIQGV